MMIDKQVQSMRGHSLLVVWGSVLRHYTVVWYMREAEISFVWTTCSPTLIDVSHEKCFLFQPQLVSRGFLFLALSGPVAYCHLWRLSRVLYRRFWGKKKNITPLWQDINLVTSFYQPYNAGILTVGCVRASYCSLSLHIMGRIRTPYPELGHITMGLTISNIVWPLNCCLDRLDHGIGYLRVGRATLSWVESLFPELVHLSIGCHFIVEQVPLSWDESSNSGLGN